MTRFRSGFNSSVGLGVILAFFPGTTVAQIAVSADLRGGVYAQVGGTGTVGATRARLQSVPAVSLGLDLRPRTGLLGARLSAVVGVSSGTTFQPTTQCLAGCSSHSIVYGLFMGIAADLVAQRQTNEFDDPPGRGPGGCSLSL